MRYDAWGEVRYQTGTIPTAYLYTGQRYFPDLELYFYNARWYDPALGRFVQPDTLVPNPGNFGDWDRYAYVRNIPIRYSDPTGHFTADEVCEYWGYCTEEAAREGLGNLFDIIYGTDITWGDLLIFRNDQGQLITLMFVLMELDNRSADYFTAGLWAVTGGRMVGWKEVIGLDQVVGYGYNEKNETSRIRTVGLSTSDFFSWYGGSDPKLKYTASDLYVGDPKDNGYCFSTYVDIGFWWWVAAGLTIGGLFTGNLWVAVPSGIAGVTGISTDGFRIDLMAGPVDRTYPVVFYDPLITGRNTFYYNFVQPKPKSKR